MRISRYDIERLINAELFLIDYNSTQNYKVYKDEYKFVWCFSYDTLIAFVSDNGIPCFTCYAQGLGRSSTHAKHTNNFIREYADILYKNVYSLTWLRKTIKDNEGTCFNYNIKNINELKHVLGGYYGL